MRAPPSWRSGTPASRAGEPGVVAGREAGRARRQPLEAGSQQAQGSVLVYRHDRQQYQGRQAGGQPDDAHQTHPRNGGLQLLADPAIQFNQFAPVIGACAPFADVVVPGLPEPSALPVHVVLIDHDEGTLENRGEYAEQGITALFLLFIEDNGFGGAAQQFQVGVVEYQFEEVGVGFREPLMQFFLVGLTFALLLKRADRREGGVLEAPQKGRG